MQTLRLSRICSNSFIIRLASNLSKESRRNDKSQSEYLAADMYNYTPVSYYDIEVDMTKFRLPQPSANAPMKPPPPPPPAKK